MRIAIALGLAVVSTALLSGCLILPIDATETHHHNHYYGDAPMSEVLAEAEVEHVVEAVVIEHE